jgi:hypothetical protein
MSEDRDRCVICGSVAAYAEIDRLKAELAKSEQIAHYLRLDKGNLEAKAKWLEEAWRWACIREANANNDLAAERATAKEGLTP